MKKGIFNGKIKSQYVAYMIISLIVEVIVFVGGGAVCLLMWFKYVPSFTQLLLVAVLCMIFGIGYPCLTVFAIRQYPKYPKLRRFCLNSDIYFVGNTTREFHGNWRGKATFDLVTLTAEQNEGLENIKYPKKYWVCLWAMVVSIVLMFGNLLVSYLLLSHIDVLPAWLQDEGLVFVLLMAAEVVFTVLAFVFAFRGRKIRALIIEEYKKKIRENNGTEH